jgi:hypothetical protein
MAAPVSEAIRRRQSNTVATFAASSFSYRCAISWSR